MRRFVVDTATALIFFTAVASLSELFIAGMDAREVLTTRLLMIPVIVLTGRPYGIWRDWLFALFRPARGVGAGATDIAAFLSFQGSVYAATLAVSGAAPTEIVAAVGSAVVLMVLLSRPYGMLLDHVRTRAGLGPGALTSH